MKFVYKGKLLPVFIASILGILYADQHQFLFILLFFAFFFICLKKYSIRFLFLLLIPFVFFQFYKKNNPPTLENQVCDSFYRVKEVHDQYLIVNDHQASYLVYKDHQEYDKEDELQIRGEIKKIEKDLDLYVFEFATYLQRKRVFYQIKDPSITIVRHHLPFNEKIKEKLLKNLSGNSLKMTKMLLLNEKNSDLILYDHLQNINATHLFVVSGFHVTFLYHLFCFFFSFTKKGKNIFAFLCCGFYIYLLDFSISSLRAFNCLFFSFLFQKKLNSMDCLSLSGLLLFLIDPLSIYQYSFILSYLLAFVLNLSKEILNHCQRFTKPIMLSFICTMSVLPLIINLTNQFNFFSFFTNIFLSFFVILLMICCLIGLCLSFFFHDLFGKVYQGFEDIIQSLSTKSQALLFGHMPLWLIVLYYGILFFLFLSIEKVQIKKFMISFSSILILLFGLYFKGYGTFYQQITFLNVYQGDCTIIQDAFTNKVMLVDTGGLKNYDVASKKIIPYLHYLGIKKIDLVVITHHDYDHEGALESLKKQIKVEKVIDDVSCKKIELGHLKFVNLNHYDHHWNSQNNQSMILYGKVCGYQILLTGDIGKEIEKELIEEYPNLQVDILKVAHHGSNTSSSMEFLQSIQPQYAIISVGANNYYGHPSSQTIENLRKIHAEIFRTDVNGTIKISFNLKDLYFFETAK